MHNTHPKMKGSISLLGIAGVVTAVLSGAYLYIDHQADTRANDTIALFVDDAKSQGVAVSYADVDASPLGRSVEITDLKISGDDQEPDISIANIILKGFSWQDLHAQNAKQNQLAPEMSIEIKNGEMFFKKSIFQNETDFQEFIATFGERVSFSTQAAYQLDPTTKALALSLKQSIDDNFTVETEISLGNMAWLNNIDSKQVPASGTLMIEAMKSTLNKLSIDFDNTGLVEKIRAIAGKQAGKTDAQLTEESINQLKQLQIASAQQWGPSFEPIIDEMITFTRNPQQLKLNINPSEPITSDKVWMAFMGGEAGLIKLIENAHVSLKAN